MAKKRISSRTRRQYKNLRKPIGRYQRTVISNINKNRNKYVSTLLNKLKGKSITEAKKIIRNAPKEIYFKRIFMNMYGYLGMNIAKGQYKLLNSQKAEEVEIEALWRTELLTFAEKHAGKQIVTLTRTLKKQLLRNLDVYVEDAVARGESIEVVTNKIVKDLGSVYNGQKWMARRIAHTETMKCGSVAQNTAVESLKIKYNKTWQTTGINTRDQHAAMNGITVGMNKIFTLPNGDKMMYPNDSSLGASAENLINCSCFVVYTPVR